jgi:hypothetical protein
MEVAMKHFYKIGLFFLTILLVAALGLSLPSCRKAREEIKEKKMEELKTEKTEGCINFTGKWDTNNGELTVLQEGCAAEGTLAGVGGGYYKLEGQVTNDTWDFAWKGPEGRGRGYFTMDPEGGKFIGEHGDGENNTGKGKWDGAMVK